MEGRWISLSDLYPVTEENLSHLQINTVCGFGPDQLEATKCLEA